MHKLLLRKKLGCKIGSELDIPHNVTAIMLCCMHMCCTHPRHTMYVQLIIRLKMVAANTSWTHQERSLLAACTVTF